jgi:hypothetical protein
VTEEQEFPCHWTHPHGRHPWTPLVVDPENPRVLHLMNEAVTCPGLPEQPVTP